jgi:protein-L-isoaspartate(D-aspartate) O-methyltransferase
MDESATYQWSKDYLVEVLTSGKNPRVTNPRLIDAFKKIDRRDFIPDDIQSEVYQDNEDEIKFGEKMESPVLQGELLNALELKEGMKVLELGTGAGYSLALIAHTIGDTGKVYSLERNQLLISQAKSNLAKYPEIDNYEIVFKDAAEGLVSRSPFAAIYATFGFKQIPENILTQLEVGGKMILPMANTDIRLITRESQEDFEDKLITVAEMSKMKYGVE